MEVIYERKINYYETDRMGVTHHSNYIRYFEEARVYFMDEMGMSYKWFEETGIIMPVLSISCKYAKSSGFDDIILIKTKINKVSPVKVGFEYEATNKTGSEIICKGESLHGFLNREFKPMSIKKENPEVFERLCEMVL